MRGRSTQSAYTAAMLTSVTAGPYTVRGVSVGGVYTSIAVPELGIVFDSGISPRSFAGIDTILLSHGHADHVANANDYAGSTWLVQRAERQAMFSAQAQTTPAFPTYSALANGHAIELTGDHDVFGDGAVVIKSTPGHTPGHQSLFVKLPVTGGVLLTGDLYHYAAERALKKIPNNDNREVTQASRAAIDDFLKKTGAQLWIQHDIGANARLKKSPLYYD